jgi:hypothetical protein
VYESTCRPTLLTHTHTHDTRTPAATAGMQRMQQPEPSSACTAARDVGTAAWPTTDCLRCPLPVVHAGMPAAHNCSRSGRRSARHSGSAHVSRHRCRGAPGARALRAQAGRAEHAIETGRELAPPCCELHQQDPEGRRACVPPLSLKLETQLGAPQAQHSRQLAQAQRANL